ncbi:aminoacyl-tRNA hydrolase [Halanaerobium hydrogeniformans]|uniref:Peptidyl-tRNA hydrolase n=1 Tax=Halanaerobium hydrogeniformans TaxID=656519 RepID=E4RJJ1_HALHG|nr:aminoacyl-tRNA hydrolase [Halanaerobium hydrogeniformans]ADQ15411.1 peptidyl-tRNA hydrolase [Halanaerobium hydrogeniformans]
MKVIAGLGNPGEKYARTRHNIGFMITAELAKKYSVNSSYKFDGLYGDYFFAGEKIIIFQPMKYMNRSGQPIAKLLRYYDIELEDLLVIHDDLDLDLGKIRFKRNGSSGGHNGIKSIINRLDSKDFKRLKVGVGRPPGNIPVSDYVLTTFQGEEKKIASEVIDRSVSAVELMLKEDIVRAMNMYNG